MKQKISFDSVVRPVYSHLDPAVELLLEEGNELARDYRWGENRTGYFCLLLRPIDFDLIEAKFEVPVSFVWTETWALSSAMKLGLACEASDPSARSGRSQACGCAGHRIEPWSVRNWGLDFQPRSAM
jgi:hypothetical protein